MKIQTGIIPVFVREIYRMATSKLCIWGLIVVPLLSTGILVYMMHEGQPHKIPIAVVDLDNSATSRTLIRQLDAFPKTDIKYKSLSFPEARKMMERDEIYAILTIPDNFSKDATSGRQPKLVYYTNNAFLLSGSLLFQDLKTISTLASASVGLQTGQAHGYREEQIMPVVQPIQVESHPLSNPYLNYSIYLNNLLLPAILQLMLFMFTVSSLGSEIKAGKGKVLLRLSGNSILKVMAGKLLPYTLIAIVIALFYMSVLYYYNQYPMNSGFVPMFINYVCLILASQAFGVVLFGLFRNYRFALSIASLVGMLTFSIMGMSFPALSMDAPLQSLGYLFPMRHFVLIYVDQGLNGIALGYSMYHYAALIGFVLLSLFFFGSVKKQLNLNVYEP
ncbi:ABC transporter permease [Dysgonomonas sp. 25]|uniref:ABC transporter permease n=1 Tax=Dysgonomonas sp. 25 TaxID=2302933 RepID=UPI0013D7597C|nr:ABC transporter permease [Dysgonomonas sp. 25]NDV69399.1 ABC transporter permease [Dysgonomonas sp. 25]